MSDPWVSLWAGPAALGFAIFFNVRPRALLAITVLAFVAHLLRGGLEAAGWSLAEASLAAAFFTGAVAYVLGPATGEASPVYAYAPVIPLVPGTLLFEGFSAVGQLVGGGNGQGDATVLLTTASQDLLTAGAVVLALALGATAPTLLRLNPRRTPSPSDAGPAG